MNILVYRVSRASLDVAKKCIIDDLRDNRFTPYYLDNPNKIVVKGKENDDILCVWFVTGRLDLLNGHSFSYYNVGRSCGCNVENIRTSPNKYGLEIPSISKIAVIAKKQINGKLVLDQNKHFPISDLCLNECIKDIIYNDPATIILWKDGTKTVVKVDGEDYDPEKGLAMAFCKKIFGNKGNYYKVFKKWLPDEIYEFEVGCKVKLKTELYGISKQMIGIIVEQENLKTTNDDEYWVRFPGMGNFCINNKYLRLV